MNKKKEVITIQDRFDLVFDLVKPLNNEQYKKLMNGIDKAKKGYDFIKEQEKVKDDIDEIRDDLEESEDL